MSSKFANPVNPQKTPKVCKKPPIIIPPTINDFFEATLQLFAAWQDSGTPLEGKISGTADLTPTGSGHNWFAKIPGDPYDIEVDLDYRAATNDFKLDIYLVSGGTIEGTRTTVFDNPQPEIPWEYGLYTWGDSSTSSTVEIKILS